jgi:uncharacterized repeat protein (TIGR02543 family)
METWTNQVQSIKTAKISTTGCQANNQLNTVFKTLISGTVTYSYNFATTLCWANTNQVATTYGYASIWKTSPGYGNIRQLNIQNNSASGGGSFSVNAGEEYVLQSGYSASLTCYYPAITNQVNTAVAINSKSGSGTINGAQGFVDLGEFYAMPQPSNGGTVSGVVYTLSWDNTNVILSFSNTGTTNTSNPRATVRVKTIDAPYILASTESQSVSTGNSTTFSVAAYGAEDLTYQWYIGCQSIRDATKASYTIPQTSITNSGTYFVVVSNAVGAVVSSAATLEVQPTNAPIIYLNTNLVFSPAIAIGSGTISFSGGFVGGLIFYTLDGSNPSAVSTLYTGSFTIYSNTIINAVSYSSDFISTAFMYPLSVQIVPQYSVNVLTSGNGTVSQYPNSSLLASNTQVSLLATASTNWSFQYWQGDLTSTNNSLMFAVNSNLSLTAVFTPTAYPLNLSTPGGGTVQAAGQTSDGINFATNSIVTLTAVTNSGWQFINWQGDLNSNTNPFSFAMNQAYNIQGLFGTPVFTQAVGGGQIVLNQTNLVAYGSNITASAIPNSGNYFVAWNGAVSGTKSPGVSTITAAPASINALFASLPNGMLSLSTVVVGNGTVTISPQQSYYTYGSVVTLNASPNNSMERFYGWTGGTTVTNATTTITVTANLVVYANFGSVIILPPQSFLARSTNSQQVALQFIGTPNYPYTLQSATNLTPPIIWLPVLTNPADANGNWQFTDTNLNGAQKFYRVMRQ